MSQRQTALVALLMLLCLVAASCGQEEPSPNPSPSPSPPASATVTPHPSKSPEPPQSSGTPTSDHLILDQGTAEGIGWKLVLRPGNPVCVELLPAAGAGGFQVCNEESEQDFNGDDHLRFAFGGVNQEQVPKFVIGITAPQVARVVINLSSNEAPGAVTRSSTSAPDRRFFAVPLDPEPPAEVLAVRGLDEEGRTVAGFRLGPPGEGPSPLPSG